MDNKGILIVNLSRGLIGEDNAALLGALLVTKVQMAAMSRADMPQDERQPFYLYVDEFQNFATDSFATILSEARKYALNLTVANQYTAQMSQEVKDAVFGNVGSIVAFRMGADDSRSMLRYFDPQFSEFDLVHMHNRHFAINMTISGEKVPAFSGVSLNLPPLSTDYSQYIINKSRSEHSVPRDQIEIFMHDRYMSELGKQAGKGKQSSSEQLAAKVAPNTAPMEAPRPAPQPTIAQLAENSPSKASSSPVVHRTPQKVAAKLGHLVQAAGDDSQAVAMPVKPANRPAVETIKDAPSSTPINEVVTADTPVKKKRKRIRKRKAKPDAGNNDASQPHTEKSKPASDVASSRSTPNTVSRPAHETAQPATPLLDDGETVINLR